VDLYDLAKELAVSAITAICVNDKKKASANELLEWVKTNRKAEFPEVQASWPSFLTRAAKDPIGPIMREPGSYGYMLRPAAIVPTPAPSTPPAPGLASTTAPATGTVAAEGAAAPVPEITQPATAPVSDGESTRTPREERLYQIFADWLSSNGYQADDTSTVRKGGSWGNPDVVGIKATQTITGTVLYELATMEAKVTLIDWKKLFFEAVSHKRFADRVYFAFAYGAETPTVSDIEEYDELRAYAEKYRIGVVVVFFDPDTYAKLVNGSQADLDGLSLDEGRVEEVWPAVLDPSSPFSRDDFLCRVLGVNNLDALYSFGKRT